MNIKHKVKVKNLKFEFFNKALFDQDLIKYEGKEILVILDEQKSTRSDNQNRYYWGVLVETIGNELGYFPEEMHEILKQKFLGYKEVDFRDERLSIPKSSAKLTTTEFEDYMSKIRIWAVSELNINLPLPNEIY